MKWDRVHQRRMLVWGAWSLVLLAGLAGLFVLHSNRSYEAALGAFAADVGSPHHKDYFPEPVPDAENAAVALVRASAGLDLGPEWARMYEPAAWSAQTQLAARELLVRNRQALDDLLAASELAGCAWPDTAVVDTQPLLALLQAARLLRVEGYVAVAEGDRARVESVFRVLGRLAGCLYAVPHLVGSLLAVSVERTQLEVVHAAVSNPKTTAGLLEHLRIELETGSQVDRVARAVAVEGALALRLLAERPPEGAVHQILFRSFLFKRMSTTLALRWTEFAAWSRRPLDQLQSEPAPFEDSGQSIAGVVADIATTNLRHAIVRLYANRALVDLAERAIEARIYGSRNGSYEGAFRERSGSSVLEEGDGSVVLIDQKLEALLRDQLPASGETGDVSAESTLGLTVWRLPPPVREE